MRGFRFLWTTAAALALTVGLAGYARGDCGNGVIDAGEDCDSGRLVCAGGLNPLQPCTTNAECFGGACTSCDTGITCSNGGNRDDLADKCRSDCQLPHCGDGVQDPGNGEQCDDGNTNNGDACHNNCKTNICGDGVRNTVPGTEDCDDGNLISGDGCSSTCKAENCGDGNPGPSEACDNGKAVCVGGLNAGATCTRNSDCLSNSCSDNTSPVVSADNRNDLPDHCRSNCTLPRCGDGTVDPSLSESCDDGNTVETDACRNNCKFNTCGDGFKNTAVGSTEECDDGNLVNGDGCSSTCKNETCGDGIKQPSEKCDLGKATCQPPALNAGDVCKTAAECIGGACSDNTTPVASADNRNDLGDHCRADCSLPRCGDGTQDPANGEQCDDGNTNDADACHNNCKTNICGDGVRNTAVGSTEDCDDGNLISGDGCSSTCKAENCGDGNPGPSEACDNGKATCTNGINLNGVCKTTADCLGGTCSDGPDNRNDLPDHCRSNCQLPSCGDGVKDALEDCDDGNANNEDACRNDCKNNVCGDGKLNKAIGSSEECDDGNLVAGDGCNASCKLESCGDGVKQPSEQCDSGKAICTSGVATGAQCNTTLQCLGGACSDNNNPVPGSDNRDDLMDHCRSNCRFPSCGDGVKDTNEACDDGNTSNNDACRNDCKVNICGDGFRNPATEQCDDGNLVKGDGCDDVCKTEKCGDGIKQENLGEECDAGTAVCAGGLVAGDPCSTNAQCLPATGGSCGTMGNRDDLANNCRSNCKLPSCGDGVKDAGEACDDGNTDNEDACTNDCKDAICGDGFVQPTEACDDGNTVSGDGCSGTCQIEKCGDNVKQVPTEQCDPPSASCSNVCCYLGPVPGPSISSVSDGFDALGGCHMAKLCKATDLCGTRVTRICQHAWQRVEQARVYFGTNRNARSIHRLESAESLLERLSRMIGRSSITCPNEAALNDEAARAADLTNDLKNAIQF